MTNQSQQQHNTSTELEEGKKVETISAIYGYWFYFQDGDDEIAVFGSGWSGKEIIYFNDNEVSQSRSWKFETAHEFTKNSKHYKVVYNVISMLTATVKCSLFIDGELTDEQTKAVFAKEGTKSAWWTILIFFAVGMVFGYFGARIALYFVGS